ncbi:SDR family oxidoreductase [Flavobacterium sp. ZT3R17]|uniref:SDR family oxidoreductase n=1 Tax=Flavobacterium cryoconiti TaxID=3398736 RepID=UPI003A852E31
MKTTKNTVLITGGGSGIGFEMAKLFSKNHNKVIIIGRNEERLKQAVSELNNTYYLVADITNEFDTNVLVEKIKEEYPDLNLLVNNAGRAILHHFATENANAFENASEEIATNYLSVIRLTEKLLPVLKNKPESAIVNVSSVVSYVASYILPTYSASKAALHSYTLSLRNHLKNTTVKIFEIMPPLVDTPFSKEIGGENGIHPEIVANDLLYGLYENKFEIHVGNTANIYQLFLSSPNDALDLLNA